MNLNYKGIKENARLSLKGNWKLAILSTLVYSIVSIIEYFTTEYSTICSILRIISDALFTFGYTAIILHIIRGQRAGLLGIFV